jgi:hypothetical protein
MSGDAIKKATDDELRQWMTQADAELKARAEKRKQDAIAEIKRIAGTVNIHVSIGGRGKAKSTLTAGDRYVNPDNPAERYTVGKGRPPGWFEKRRAKGALPPPEVASENLSSMKRAG